MQLTMGSKNSGYRLTIHTPETVVSWVESESMPERRPGASQWREGVGVRVGYIYTQGTLPGSSSIPSVVSGLVSGTGAAKI